MKFAIMRRIKLCFFLIGLISVPVLPACAVVFFAQPAFAQEVTIGNITTIQGVRTNQLIGYGLVVGLNGTGDQLNSSLFTRQSLVGLLSRLGLNLSSVQSQLRTKDVAAVMVTAALPAFAHNGQRISVNVSAMGDASSLRGGVLLVTPLMAADGEVYAIAQGPVIAGGVSAQGATASVTQGVPTSGLIPNGGTVERTVPFVLASETRPYLALLNPDLITAERVASAINSYFKQPLAVVANEATVDLNLTGMNVVNTLATISGLTVSPVEPATVVINDATGTIVMGANVRISTVAIAEGNITVRVTTTPVISQPAPFSFGTTVVAPSTKIEIEDKKKHMAIVTSGTSLRSLVDGLNALGVTPHEMINILESIQAAGALQARLIVR